LAANLPSLNCTRAHRNGLYYEMHYWISHVYDYETETGGTCQASNIRFGFVFTRGEAKNRGSGTSGLVYVDSTQVQYQEEVRFRVCQGEYSNGLDIISSHLLTTRLTKNILPNALVRGRGARTVQYLVLLK
jgi:hypothetical protein